MDLCMTTQNVLLAKAAQMAAITELQASEVLIDILVSLTVFPSCYRLFILPVFLGKYVP